MRKRLIDQPHTTDHRSLDLERIASVEITSEDPAHRIEDALRGDSCGWRAATPGEQFIRLTFDDPASLGMIELRFEEVRTTRTHEFSLRWAPDRGGALRDIVRQQFTFSPPATTCESERYSVDVHGVTVLELYLTPDIAGGAAVASLNRLRVT